eukprot:Em0978g1a
MFSREMERCGRQGERKVFCQDMIEGKMVKVFSRYRLLLDDGSPKLGSRTQIDRGKGGVAIRCAHGDTTFYPAGRSQELKYQAGISRAYSRKDDRDIARVGVLREILTEEGSNFVSQLLAVLEQATSSEAYPDQSIPSTMDGLVERFNKAKMASEDGKDWDRMIPIPSICQQGGASVVDKLLSFRATLRSGCSRTT